MRGSGQRHTQKLLLSVVAVVLFSMPIGARAELIPDIPSAEALAASSPSGAAERPKLRNASAFGLLGLLENHRFRRFNVRGELVNVTFKAIDSNTILWFEDHPDPWVRDIDSQEGVRLMPDGTIVTVIASRYDGKDARVLDSKPLSTGANYFSSITTRYIIDASGDLTIDGVLKPRGLGAFGMWALGHEPSLTPVEVHEAYNASMKLVKYVCDGDESSLDICAEARLGAANFLAMSGTAETNEIAKARQDARDAQIAYDQKENSRLAGNEANNAAAREQAQENFGSTLGMLNQTQAIFQSRTASNSMQHPSVNAPPSTQALYDAQPAARTSGASALTFGSLPPGVGTMVQRQFWAKKCENQVNDGSSAARGCEQTRDLFHSIPRQTQNGAANSTNTAAETADAHFNRSDGNSYQQSATPLHCTSLRPQAGASMGFWEVVNQCSFTAIGNFCYDDNSSDGCVNHGGGFGPLGSGMTEGVSPPTNNPGGHINYRVRSCKYDEFNAGVCKLEPF